MQERDKKPASVWYALWCVIAIFYLAFVVPTELATGTWSLNDIFNYLNLNTIVLMVVIIITIYVLARICRFFDEISSLDDYVPSSERASY